MMHNILNKEIYKKHKKGIVIFIAVVTVGALLLIAMSISNISYKEQLISSSGRDSRIAFYAADSGVECALFHDLKGGNQGDFQFALPDGGAGIIDQVGNNLVCDGSNGATGNPISTNIDQFGSSVATTFHFNLPDVNACAIVEITKTFVSATQMDTRIESSGYNNTCTNGDMVDEGPRNLERTFEVNY